MVIKDVSRMMLPTKGRKRAADSDTDEELAP